MDRMAQRILRPLGYGDMLDETFDLYRSNFLLYVGISAVVNIPVDLCLYGFGVSESYFICTLSLILYSVSSAATTWAVSQTYLGRTTTVAGSYRSIKKRALSFCLTMLFLYFMFFCGLIMLVIPGIVLLIWYAFVHVVFIVEGKSGRAAMRRSKELSVNHRFRIFVFTVLCLGVTIAISQMLTYSANSIFGTDVHLKGGLPGLFFGLSDSVIFSFTWPIWSILYILLYYDIRVRKEGFDLELLAADLERANQPEPFRQEEEKVH